MRRWIKVAFVLGMSLVACEGQFSSGPRKEIFPNASLDFPPGEFSHVQAFAISAPEKAAQFPPFDAQRKLAPWFEGEGKTLSPAHRADLAVGIGMAPEIAPAPNCFVPHHALVYRNGEQAVGVLLLSFACASYRFYPPSKQRLGPNNLKRLRLIFSESN